MPQLRACHSSGVKACACSGAPWLRACPTIPPLQYYDVPSLSLRDAAWQLWRAGVDGFKARLGMACQPMLVAGCVAPPLPMPHCSRATQLSPLFCPALLPQVDRVLKEGQFLPGGGVVPQAAPGTEGRYFWNDV